MDKFAVDIAERILHFKEPAGTSRGVYTTRTSWLVTLRSLAHPQHAGVGECAPLPDLSSDAGHDYMQRLSLLCHLTEQRQALPLTEMEPFPSMAFGLETAWMHYTAGSYNFFDTAFGRGETTIPVNGLVWMGSYDQMLTRMQQKLDEGYKCVKLKIGAIDFAKELELMRIIRSAFSADCIQLRVDANGAFAVDEALSKLDAISKYDIHSIEQPIRQGQWADMAKLCKHSPIPIALDEELIGHYSSDSRRRLLDAIMPQYIVIKPSLHGGMRGSSGWIEEARSRGIDSWITSALESNIGLNAVAQLAAHCYSEDALQRMPQGLGTGQLFTDNIDLPFRLEISHGAMRVRL